MKRVLKIILIIIFISGNLFSQVDQITNKLPKIKNGINDFENILEATKSNELAFKIKDFENKTINVIAVVTIDSIKPYNDFTLYSVDLAKSWKIRKKSQDYGLLIVVSKSLREVTIVTASGTKKILTDKITKEIIDNIMIPKFKTGEYYNGIKTGLFELINLWK